jgi:cytidylate kinase
MKTPIDLPNIRLMTISGRIGAGSTSLAKKLAEIFAWKHIEGGEVFWEDLRKKKQLSAKDTHLRSDKEDIDFDTYVKQLLQEEKHCILETKLAGFFAQGLKDVFKIGVICDNADGEDQPQIRIDRLVNREQISLEDAKQEVTEREAHDLSKWRQLYAAGNKGWVYWDKKYFDLVVNTYSHSQEESVDLVLDAIGFKK